MTATLKEAIERSGLPLLTIEQRKLADAQRAAQGTGEPLPDTLADSARLFDVPAQLVKIMDRDLKLAKID